MLSPHYTTEQNLQPQYLFLKIFSTFIIYLFVHVYVQINVTACVEVRGQFAGVRVLSSTMWVLGTNSGCEGAASNCP